ncbi:MAG: cobaltochelatase subunit CobN [Candidatus Omnitrophota bacterium]|nr:MAG: cobaltochelatase subunit CobN [Candidatus Omnitrophota bacterium]
MKIGAVIWGASSLNCLVDVARNINEIKLFAFSMHQLKDEKERSRCIEKLKRSDLVFLYISNNDIWQKISPEIEYLTRKIPVICVSSDPSLFKISNVNPDIVKTCYEYLKFGGRQNFKNMFLYIGKKILGLNFSFKPPKQLSWEGIVNPFSVEEVFTDVEEYCKRFIKSERPVVGILFYRCYWVNQNMEVEKALIEEFKRQNINVIACFSESIGKTEFGSKPGYQLIKEYFLDKSGKPRIDAFINLQSSILSEKGIEGGINLLKKLGVPVFHPIVTYYKTEKEWREDKHGIGSSISWSVALPEFQGMVEPIIIGAMERNFDEKTGTILERFKPIKERIEKFVLRIKKWIQLKRTPPEKRKVAFILHNNPCASVEATVGCGSHLDTLESVVRILKEMKERGYKVDPPKDGKELISTIMKRKAISEFRWTTTDEIVKKGGALSFISKERYLKWFEKLPEKVKNKMCNSWGNPPGEERDGVPAAMVYKGKILVTGIKLGNAVVCVQPKRGCAGARCDGKVCKILHDPEVPPPHQYIATYRYLEDDFAANVIIHVGTHGNLEFLPGKSVGLSDECFPDIAIGNLPHLYIYNADNPAEGVIAKRRSYATLVDHMQTVMVSGGLYDKLEELERLLSEYNQAKISDRLRAHTLKHEIIDKIKEANLDKEIKISLQSTVHSSQNKDYAPSTIVCGQNVLFEEVIKRTHEVLTRLRTSLIPDGMHIFGENPKGEGKLEFINSILKYDSGDGLSIRKVLFELMGEDLDFALKNPSYMSKIHKKTYSELIKELDSLSLEFIRRFLNGEEVISVAKDILKDKLKNIKEDKLLKLKEKVEDISRRIDETDEVGSLLSGESAEFIEPGPSGLITRGRADVLPTGRNFYSLDPKKIPTSSAWKVGKRLTDALIEKFRQDSGRFPENIAMVWFSSDIMWADGEEMAQIMYLLGVKPTWEINGRVNGFEIIPLKELKRPRIDVTIRLSGIIRDSFPECVELLDEATQTVAFLDEPVEMNFVRKHTLERIKEHQYTRAPEHQEIWRKASLRMFSSKPGAYGSGVNLAIYASAWRKEKDLSNVFIYWNGYAYGKGFYGKELHNHFIQQLKSVEATFNKSVTDEYDLLGCCCYFSTQGGISCAAKSISGKEVKNYYGDIRDPSCIRVTDLSDEIRRVVRTKLLNPKWIEGMKRHGYKGASEISKRVGRVYGWQATTGEVDDWIFDDIAKTFVLNREMREFFEENNPWSLEEISRRLLEAERRNLWNADPEVLEKLENTYLEIESWLEEKMGDVKGDFQGGSVDILTSEDVADWGVRMREIERLVHSQ